MSYKTVGIVDYDLGNLFSVERMIKDLNYNVIISSKKQLLSKCDFLILPGVGTFPVAMRNLQKMKLISFIQEWVSEKKFLLGICLGMQLLCENSYEINLTKGLGVIPGNVTPLKNSNFNIGWSKLTVINKNSIFKNFNEDFFYFNHKFEYSGPDKFQISKTYNKNPIASILVKNNSYGFQFHPEKSQISGVKIMKYILERAFNDNKTTDSNSNY